MARESAEEKLLKMMQKSAPSVAVKASAPVVVKKKFQFSFSIRTLNLILFLVILVSIIWVFAFEIPSGCALLNKTVDFPFASKPDLSMSESSLPSVSSVDYYLKSLEERNIFKPYVPKTAEKKTVQGLAQQMAKYKLVGIAWLDLPESASIMIEDTRKNETIFLKAGEQLEGVTVKTIYTDRVVFSHENEETTIKL